MTTRADGEHAPVSGFGRITSNLGLWLSLIGRPRRAAAGRLLPPTLWLAGGTLLGVALIGAAMVALDGRGVGFARSLSPWVVDTFNEITDYGRSGWVLIPIALVVAVAAVLATPAVGRLANGVLMSVVMRLEYIFLAVAVPGLIVTVLKGLVGRARPSDLGPFTYDPWTWSHKFASLPSGHGTSAFATAVAIGALWPRARPYMWTFAVVIGLSRVIITAHFVSDVIAGGLIGAFGAVLVRNWFAARRLVFVTGADGKTRAFPGPSWRRIKTVARRLVRQ